MEAKEKIDNRLCAYIHNSISKLSQDIDPVFYPIIEELLTRRAYYYGLSQEQVAKDIRTLEKWVTRIDIEKISFSNGYFCSTERRIVLDVEFLKKCLDEGKYDEVFKLIAHELTHALCTDEDGQDILAVHHDGRRTFYDKILRRLDNARHNSLLELIVSELSERLIFSRKKDSKSSIYHSQTRSYSKSSEILELIEASYGVSEKELLDHAIFGRREMAQFLAEKSGQDIDEVLNYLDMFETQYTCLHKAIYYSSESVSNLALLNNITNLYNLCIKTMNKRIENVRINSIDQAKLFCEALKFEYNKLSYLIDSFVDKTPSKKVWISIQHFFNGTGDDLLQHNFNESEYPLASKILKMERVLRANDDSKNEDEILRDFNSVKATPLEENKMHDFSAAPVKGFLFSISTEALERYREEDTEWNNESIYSYIQGNFSPLVEKAGIIEQKKEESENKHLESKNPFERLFYALKIVFVPQINRFKEDMKNLFSRKQKQLPNPEINTSMEEEHNAFLRDLQVDESITNINSGTVLGKVAEKTDRKRGQDLDDNDDENDRPLIGD